MFFFLLFLNIVLFHFYVAFLFSPHFITNISYSIILLINEYVLYICMYYIRIYACLHYTYHFHFFHSIKIIYKMYKAYKSIQIIIHNTRPDDCIVWLKFLRYDVHQIMFIGVWIIIRINQQSLKLRYYLILN